jgi:NAD(P)-dependent dehydrogenase (short-subunit alcohol dehydrogenase family)
MTKLLSGRVALVTGGSRGVGAATVKALAAAGADVVVNYRTKSARATAVACAAREQGVRALTAGADITDRRQVAEMFDSLREVLGRLDILVLNASGGMERELLADNPGYPMAVNRDAPLLLLELARPLMSAGSVVVHVTSHLAHFYGQVEQIPEYEPVAASKHAGEIELARLMPDLTRAGIRLAIVSGDLIEDTIVPRLMDRRRPGLIAARRGQAGSLPTTRDMAEAIVRASADHTLPSGHVVFVGDPATVELSA